MTPRTVIITDWSPAEVLPDVVPGTDIERVIRPQVHVTIASIVTTRLELVRVEVGNHVDVPFKLIPSVDIDSVRRYRFEIRDHAGLRACGADLTAGGLLALPAGMEIRVTLRNTRREAVKPRVSIIVYVEGPS